MIQKYGLDWDLHWILNWTEAVNILSENTFLCVCVKMPLKKKKKLQLYICISATFFLVWHI